jgi:hypothetical protein
MSGTGNPRVPVTRTGASMGRILYPRAGMGFLASIYLICGHGYRIIVPESCLEGGG